jgi:hypothetical protein
MTEQEWLNSANPEPMLDFLRGKGSQRKARLFTCACCRRIWHLLTDERSRRAVELSEQYADGEVSVPELTASRIAAYSACFEIARENPHSAAYRAAGAAFVTANHDFCDTSRVSWSAWSAADQENAEQQAQARLIQELYGNPFHPASLTPSGLPASITTLAQGVYHDRRFQDLPILADALEEASCTSADVLSHCRGPGSHVRGCWALDLILGKS